MKLSPKHLLYIVAFGLIALIPLLLLFNLTRKFVVNVPYGDEWVYVPLIAKMHAGQVTFSDLWAQHNEHRIVFPRLLMLGLASLNGWDVTLETYASFILAVLAWLILQRLLVITLPTSRLILFSPLMTAMALLIFSLQQGQSWLWGFQVCWFLSNFFVILGIGSLAFWQGQWRGIILAALAAVGATYSLAAGQLVWGVVLIGLLLDRKTWRPSMIISWLVAAVLAIGAYFYNYHPTGNLFLALQHPFDLVYYILAYLGSPLGLWGVPSPLFSTISAVYGLAGIIGLTIATTWLWKAQPQTRTNILPWLQLAMFASASAIITGMGRITLGIEQALSSHYVTISILFWIGLSVILIIAGQEFFSRQRQWRWSGSALAGIVISFILMGYLRSAIKGAIEIEAVGVQMKTGLAALYHYETAPDNALLLLKEDALTIRGFAKVLEALNEGPFSSRSKAKNQLQLQADSWVSALTPERYAHTAYPADVIQMSVGDSATLTRIGDTVTFSNSNRTSSSFYVDLTKTQQSWPILSYPFLQPPVLDIQSKNALYLYLYWNTGSGLNGSEQSTLYGLETPDGWKHFRHSVWPGTKGFRVDLHYSTTEPISDSLRIDTYHSR